MQPVAAYHYAADGYVSFSPCFAPGWQIAPFKIAASGAKMRPPRNDTKMIGFTKKPTIFLIEIF